MADFFEDPKKPDEEVSTDQQPDEKIKLGSEEYTQGELSRLVGLGKLAEESEQKFSTRIDKVWPDYTKTKNQVKELEEKLSTYESQQKANQSSLVPQDEITKAREAAKQLGILTDDSFEQKLSGSFRQLYLQERAAERLLEDTDRLLEQVAKDGKPKATREEILNFMQESGARTPEFAYKQLREQELDAWKEQQLRSARRPGFVTQTSGSGNKFPKDVKVTKDNLNELVRESLRGNSGDDE